MLILCNPHNPIGKVWSMSELAKVGQLCSQYGVTVLSDEIHCDLTEPGTDYVPFAAASDICKSISVTAISASKAFSIPGLQSAAVFVADENLRNKVVRGLNSDEVAEPNVFACDVTVAAFTKGGEWLDQVRAYISQNRKLVGDFLSKNLPQIKLIEQNATYLLWLDCSKVTDNSDDLCQFVRKETGLYLCSGNQYRGNGSNFVRLNVACARQVLIDGLKRFQHGVEQFLKQKSL